MNERDGITGAGAQLGAAPSGMACPDRRHVRGSGWAVALLAACTLLGSLALTGCSKNTPRGADAAVSGKAHDPMRAAVPGFTAEPGESGCKDVAAVPESLPGAQSIVYRTASKRPLRLFVFPPAKTSTQPSPAVLFFFGGGWRSGSVASFVDQAHAFAAQGYVAVLADYRVSCRDGTTPLAAVSDARAAYKWLRKHAADFGIAPTQIVLSGGAAGGQLALVTAMEARSDRKPAALVLFNPVVDLVSSARWYLKPLARQISPTTLSVQGLPPTLILHGEGDQRVAIASVRAFCDKARNAHAVCEVHGYPGEDHGFYHRRTVSKTPPVVTAGAASSPAVPRMAALDDGNTVGVASPAVVPPFDDTTARALAFLQKQLLPI